jgi:hypothetical protein
VAVALCSRVSATASNALRAGRREDLREAGVWVAGSLGVGIKEVTVSNDRPIREVAAEILEWLDWGDFAVA